MSGADQGVPAKVALAPRTAARVAAVQALYQMDMAGTDLNAVIDEFWDYSEQDHAKAVQISHDYFTRFGDPDAGEKYKPPRQRPSKPDPRKK